MIPSESAVFERQIDRLNEVIDRLDQINCKLKQENQRLERENAEQRNVLESIIRHGRFLCCLHCVYYENETGLCIHHGFRVLDPVLKPGDRVIMTNRYPVPEKNKDKVFTVISEPWDLCGTMVVMLDGLHGGYAVDGLAKVREGGFVPYEIAFPIQSAEAKEAGVKNT